MGGTQSASRRTDSYTHLIKQAIKKYDDMIRKKLNFEEYGTKSSKSSLDKAEVAYEKSITKLDKYEMKHGLGTNVNRSNRRYGPSNYWRIVHGHFYED